MLAEGGRGGVVCVSYSYPTLLISPGVTNSISTLQFNLYNLPASLMLPCRKQQTDSKEHSYWTLDKIAVYWTGTNRYGESTLYDNN